MTPARFQTIEEIFHSTRAQGPEQRGPFLDGVCAGDAELRAEVELLLASHERASIFIERPAIALANRILQSESADSLVGQRFGHYELVRQLGAGGMGEVYLAADMTAGRKAALKLLPLRFTGDAERLRRFEQEARAVVALNHPNIVTVYEIGEDRSTHFIASELINGETLRAHLERGPMEVDAALDVAIQVASALAAAHEAGVIHRDIKPENIMLRPDGYVKVLDFGIAKLAEEEATMAEPDAAAFLETRVGSIMGTARYMSPEQARGAAVDQRTDIWSLGVVLYEMVTGQAPFHGENTEEVKTSILETEPEPLTNDRAELEQVVTRTLRKEPNERHANARELIEALKKVRRRLELTAESKILKTTPVRQPWRRWAAALLLLLVPATLALRFYWTGVVQPKSPPPIKSIAVLPFDNLSGDQQNASFAVAVQDEILSDLAKIADLKVISRTSARLYDAGKPRNSGQIGRELGVAHLVEGNVQRTGNHLRINAQLIDTRTDSHLWAQTYDRDVSDIFALQSEIARTIAEQLHAKISERERLAMARPRTVDLIAQDLYTQALLAENELPGPPDLRKAIGLLERALARDPHFVLAYCALGRDYLTLVSNGATDVATDLKMAQSMIEKAARIEPDAGEVHLLRAHYLGYTTGDYDRARAELELARRALPNNAAVYVETALIDRRQGRWSEALMNLDRAVELDPRNEPVLVEAASTYYNNRRYAEGTRLLDRAIALAPKDYDARLLRAERPLYERADTRPLRAELDAILAEDPPAASTIADTLLDCALFERDAAAADRAVAAIPAGGFGTGIGMVLPREYFAARVARTFHRPEIARAGFEAARSTLQKLVHEQPDLAEGWSRLGLVEAALGQKEEAIKAGLRAREIMPVSRQAFAGGRMLRELAKIYAWVGEKEQALALLATCARENYSIDSAVLKLDPDWDSLRGDPRFDKIVASLAPK